MDGQEAKDSNMEQKAAFLAQELKFKEKKSHARMLYGKDETNEIVTWITYLKSLAKRTHAGPDPGLERWFSA